MSDQSSLDARVSTLEELARTILEALARFEANQARFEANQARFEANQTEMRVALMERSERLEDTQTQILDQVAIQSMAVETVRRADTDHRAELEAQRRLIASQRKSLDTVEEQILLLQRQITRLGTQVHELRGGGSGG